MAEERAKVKEVEERCKRIHEAAGRLNIRLDSVAITEERTVSLCSHAEHEPSSSSRWRISLVACSAAKNAIRLKVDATIASSGSLVGVTQMALDRLRELEPLVVKAPEPKCEAREEATG